MAESRGDSDQALSTSHVAECSDGLCYLFDPFLGRGVGGQGTDLKPEVM